MPQTVAQVVVMLLVIICEIFANYQLPISNYLALFRGKQGDLLPEEFRVDSYCDTVDAEKKLWIKHLKGSDQSWFCPNQ